MADVVPDYNLEQYKLMATIAQLKASMANFKCQIVQFESNRKNTLGNIRATEAAISEHEERLAGLIETHGAPADISTEGVVENG